MCLCSLHIAELHLGECPSLVKVNPVIVVIIFKLIDFAAQNVILNAGVNKYWKLWFLSLMFVVQLLERKLFLAVICCLSFTL